MSVDHLWGPNGEMIPLKKEQEHFASRSRVGQYLDLVWNVLPDPDPILAKVGKSYSGLRELMMDEQVETAWASRCSAATRTPWNVVPGASDRASKKIADFCKEIYQAYKIKDINAGLLEHILYGFVPVELLWDSVDGNWIPLNIVPKPQEWFGFNKENKLVLKKGLTEIEDLPEYRFQVLQNRPTYINPYGVKLLSKIFWSVTFRRSGARWWAVFTEKFGGAFATAKHPRGATEKETNEILEMLENLITCGVATFPEDTSIDINTDTAKSQATGNFSEFESFFNANISKVLLGATLTTDIGKTGSYSAAQVHLDVREDFALSDREAIVDFHNDVLRKITVFNFGNDAASPRFIFQEPEDLKAPVADRDQKIYALGWRPTKQYIAETYGISEELFDIVDPTAVSVPSGFSVKKPPRTKSFSSPDSDGSTAEFMAQEAAKGQKLLNTLMDEYNKDVSLADSYEKAFSLMLKRYPKQKKFRKRFAEVIDNLRFAFSQLGADDNKAE
ncbi:MAG TPA: DUF935 family protein [Rectinemataceae bacterium]|nr:DUF935 family protein [Rectinemataceae bacterium]